MNQYIEVNAASIRTKNTEEKWREAGSRHIKMAAAGQRPLSQAHFETHKLST